MVIFSLALLPLGCERCGTARTSATSPSPRTDETKTAAADAKHKAKNSEPLPLIDSHVHITPLPETVNMALRIFSQTNVRKFAVKSAGIPGGMRFEMTARIANVLGERMAFFSTVDWEDIDEPGWGKREADRLAKAVEQGARGVKIFKALGLGVRFKNGKLMKVDDPKMEPIWRKAGELGAIVAWHVADPVAFFEPVNEKNERYGELSMAPEWSFHGKDYPSHAELLAARDRVVKAHPKTTFLGIHLANYPENIDYVDKLLDACPNMYVDTSARLGEIGRHPPDKVRALFVKHQDRILFGTDLIVTPRGMQLGSVSETPPTFEDALKFYADHRLFFETAKRNIDHPTPSQGPWKVNAINLPAAVLRKFYVENADRLIFAHRRAWLKEHAAEITKEKKAAQEPVGR